MAGSISNPTSSSLTVEQVESTNLKNEAVTAAKVKASEIPTLAAASNKFTGKIGINNTAPPAQSADSGAMSTSVAITLLTEVAPILNSQAEHINAMRTCLRNHGLMA